MRDWINLVHEVKYITLDSEIVLAAKRAGLEMRDSLRTRWFTVDGIGFAGVMLFTKTARLVSAYVIPLERRQGLRTTLISVRLAAAKNHGCTEANLITTRPDWYIKRGWEMKHKAKKPGWYWVKKCLNQ